MIITRPISPAESDLLAGMNHKRLRFTSVDDENIIEHPSPPTGWTHDLLEAVTPPAKPWDAWLGHVWIGSSEI